MIAYTGAVVRQGIEGHDVTHDVDFQIVVVPPLAFGSVTVILQLAEIPLTVAVIVAVPAPFAVTRPLPDTEATASLEDVH